MGKGTFTPHLRADVSLASAPRPDDRVWMDPSSGIIFNYDDERGKWLSASKDVFEFARKNASSGMYIPVLGDLDDVEDVYTFRRPATITGIICRSKQGNRSKSFTVRVNGVVVWNFQYINGVYMNAALDIDVEAMDELQLYINGGDYVKNTVCRVEFAWRYVV
jgi:hypothetical protein